MSIEQLKEQLRTHPGWQSRQFLNCLAIARLYTSKCAENEKQFGLLIRLANSIVILSLGTANRDEHFPNAARLDILRQNEHHHLAFGLGGVHHCLGVPLPRGKIALQTILERIMLWHGRDTTEREMIMNLIQRHRKDGLIEDTEHLSYTFLPIQESIGGLIPEFTDAEQKHIHDVLEIACGPGIWSLEMAQAYPKYRCTGINMSCAMITAAQQEARDRRLDIRFLHVDSAAGPFSFADASFDLISAQCMSCILFKDSWTCLLQECYRLLRPGGWVRFVDFEVGLSNAPAHETMWTLYAEAMQQGGLSLAPGNRHLGLCNLEPLLFGAGFQTQCKGYLINYSHGTELYREWSRGLLLFFKAIEPLLIKTGVSTPEVLSQLYQQQQREMSVPNFHAMLPLMTISGRK